ncbi:Phosphohistidine phosphatase SixA [Beggiatoa sp. PS]|nr:Phosphohistidine phosphatase SixA [Beggiatoa sp. PS]
MALYLVQHGKSLPKDKDPEQELSEEGILEVKRIANQAKEYGIAISSIQHSGKNRAQQTAKMMASALNPPNGIQPINGINPLDDVFIFANKINSKHNIMVIGHLPFMERLTSHLITGSIDKLVLKFQNAGIICLDTDDNGSWFIKWTLMPRIG